VTHFLPNEARRLCASRVSSVATSTEPTPVIIRGRPRVPPLVLVLRHHPPVTGIACPTPVNVVRHWQGRRRDQVEDRLRIHELAWHSEDGRACPTLGDALRDIAMEERQDMRVMTETRLKVSSLVERVINLDIVYNGVTMQAEA
jgi:hypothetical protein